MDNSVVKEMKIFQSILDSPGAFIVSWYQQKGAEEMSPDQRLEILAKLYREKKLIFLVRYNQYLTQDQLEFIRESCGGSADEEVAYYLEKLIPSRKVNLVKQRRYAALQSLIKDGNYFNDNNMRERNPNLYEQMVGRYQSTEEKSRVEAQDRDASEIQRPLSSFLLRQLDKNRREESRLEQKAEDGDEYSNDDAFFKRIQRYNREDDGEQEIDEEEEEEDEENDASSEASKALRKADQEHKEYLRKEFTNIMYESFLEGRDRNFDYGAVDSNDTYDPISLMDRDAEDSWFDSEEPS